MEEEEEYYRQQEELLLLQEQAEQAQAAQQVKAQQQQKDEVKQAADEAAKAAQEAAKAAAEASQGLIKGISSIGGNLLEQSGGFGFGFGGGSNKKQSSWFRIGGFGLGSLGGLSQPAKKAPEPAKPKQAAAPAQKAPVAQKPVEVKLAADLYPKPYTAHMSARERWWWAYRMTVQVNTQQCRSSLKMSISTIFFQSCISHFFSRISIDL